jgi:hypothetical protein
MSTGVERADAHRGAVDAYGGAEGSEGSAGESRAGAAADRAAWAGPAEDADGAGEPDIAPRREGGRRWLAALLLLLAALWIGAVGYAAWIERPELSPGAVVAWIATASAPLILVALLWLIFGKTQRRETEAFAASIAALKAESRMLEAVLASVGGRLDENRAALGEGAARLMSLGEEASDRLGRVTHYLARETETLDRTAQALESAAAAARVDIGVLLGDLPRAESQARAAAEAMREAGLAAHGQAGALESQLAALAARGREADEQVGGAAQRLGAHLARIETSTASAAARMDEAAAGMDAAVDGALARAAEAVGETRKALDLQAQALLAGVEQGRAAFEDAGAEASRRLIERLDAVGGMVEALAGRIGAGDETVRALADDLSARLGDIAAQIAEIDARGGAATARLGEGLSALSAAAARLIEESAAGAEQAGALEVRAGTLDAALGRIGARLGGELADGLAAAEAQAQRTGDAAQAAAPTVERMREAADAAAAQLAECEASLARQQAALAALDAAMAEGSETAQRQTQAIVSAIGEADGAARALADRTGPELVEALVRVREAAQQAAGHARDAIEGVIPSSAAALAEASRSALAEALDAPVRAQIADLAAASEQALAAAQAASERLTRQLLTIAGTAAAVEARIESEREARAAAEGESLSRRVALLIESLNSTAIDVTKILSNDVTDSAWAAYLKGDRGVFTRRAVRLLDSGEAREVVRHYDEEPEFREQVNRYIHDFEAMLRRVLADREGTQLGITLLSSDMGKLYVALAQAIERLRR